MHTAFRREHKYIQKSKMGPLPVAQNNMTAFKTSFDPILNTFDLVVAVTQANKASVRVDSASTIGGTHVKGNHFLSPIKIPIHMSHDLRRGKGVLTLRRHVEQGVRRIPFLAIHSACTLS